MGIPTKLFDISQQIYICLDNNINSIIGMMTRKIECNRQSITGYSKILAEVLEQFPGLNIYYKDQEDDLIIIQSKQDCQIMLDHAYQKNYHKKYELSDSKEEEIVKIIVNVGQFQAESIVTDANISSQQHKNRDQRIWEERSNVNSTNVQDLKEKSSNSYFDSYSDILKKNQHMQENYEELSNQISQVQGDDTESPVLVNQSNKKTQDEINQIDKNQLRVRQIVHAHFHGKIEQCVCCFCQKKITCDRKIGATHNIFCCHSCQQQLQVRPRMNNFKQHQKTSPSKNNKSLSVHCSFCGSDDQYMRLCKKFPKILICLACKQKWQIVVKVGQQFIYHLYQNHIQSGLNHCI